MITSVIAAMPSPEKAVWLIFLFHALNLLLPVIPAVIIYLLFPEGTTKGKATSGQLIQNQPKPGAPQPSLVPDGNASAAPSNQNQAEPLAPQHSPAAEMEGNIGGWKIKALGAWGAYVTAFLLGFWAVNSAAIPLIKRVGGASVWEIDSDFKFVDGKGHEVSDTVDKLIVEPPKVKPWGKHATITVFSETLDPPDQIQVKMDGYDYQTVDLGNCSMKKGKLKLPVVTLQRLPPISAGPAPTPLPAGAGPPAVAVNQ